MKKKKRRQSLSMPSSLGRVTRVLHSVVSFGLSLSAFAPRARPEGIHSRALQHGRKAETYTVYVSAECLCVSAYGFCLSCLLLYICGVPSSACLLPTGLGISFFVSESCRSKYTGCATCTRVFGVVRVSYACEYVRVLTFYPR